MKRRNLLGCTLAGMAAMACRPLSAFADGAAAPLALGAAAPLMLLVGGPAGGQTSRWGNACALALSNCLPGTPEIMAQPTGGLDGVTVANQLDALVVPDGKTAAILPGAVLIAYLMGDERVHYDPTRWQPLMTGVNSGVLMLRASPNATAAANAAALRTAAPLRLAAGQPQSPDLAAMLGLARLGISTAPVLGLRDTDAKTRAFANGEVDAVFLCGEGVPEDVASLTAAGAVPFFSIGALGPDGRIGPDPFFPDLPEASSLGPAVTPDMDAAYQAAATAAQIDFLLVLPKLTDPGAANNWTLASLQAAASPALAAAASASSITLQPNTALAGALQALAIPQTAQSSMQAYLAKNCGWQPG